MRKDIQFGAHLFRRTFATLLFKTGMNIRAVQGATRHSSIETLAKHYLDATEATAPYFNKIPSRSTAWVSVKASSHTPSICGKSTMASGMPPGPTTGGSPQQSTGYDS